MEAAHPVSALMFATLGIVLLALIGAFVYSMRRQSSRESMKGTPERGEPGAPDVPRGTPIDGTNSR